MLVDSMVAIGCLSKGRSSVRALLRLCRQAASVGLACGLRFLLRYVPSEWNVADGPSRGLGLGVAPETALAHQDREQPSTGGQLADLRQLARQLPGFAGG